MRILLIGILTIASILCISAAIVAAAPYIAIIIVIVAIGAYFSLTESKNDKPPE